jgi:flagellar basal body P-ring protein FlgI
MSYQRRRWLIATVGAYLLISGCMVPPTQQPLPMSSPPYSTANSTAQVTQPTPVAVATPAIDPGQSVVSGMSQVNELGAQAMSMMSMLQMLRSSGW